MSRFISAMSYNDTRTENGMPTHSTSDSKLVDMFYRMGASRNLDPTAILSMFGNAFGEDELLALKAAFYNRDIRGGQGERRSFRIMFEYLCNHYPKIAKKNIKNVIKFGRWDDLFVAFGTPVEDSVLKTISKALRDGDALCAKWMPRENKRNREIASKIRKYMGLSPKGYRKMLSELTQVVESQMCDQDWDNIEYSHVPSRAMTIYRDAFRRHNPSGFEKWIVALEKGESTVHAGTLYPYDIVNKILQDRTVSTQKLLQAQWDSLPDYMPKGRRIFPMVDVSGSMTCAISNKTRVTCLMVAISLGLYLSERNIGPFKDSFLTFSERPEFYTLKSKKLFDRIHDMETSRWGMNTDIMLAFRTMLNRAVAAKVLSAEMPEVLLILSDMQFDSCVRGENALDSIKREYSKHGYELPKIVFWNLRATPDKQSPVKYRQDGTALVSGFSPSIMKSVLTGEFMTPERVMLDTLNQERYDSVVI